MIIETHDIFPVVSPEFLDRIQNKTLFFDIETTGFSPNISHLYMIGASYYSDHAWKTIQWFDETGLSVGEQALLQAFSEFAKDFIYCISYNGTAFDFSYIEKKCTHYHLQNPLSHLQHMDLYKEIKPYGAAFDLPNLKQKSIEAFLGIGREDKYNGGQLIKVYKKYLQFHAEHEQKLLFIHNYEDIIGMIKLLPLLSYIDFFKGHFSVTNMQISDINKSTINNPKNAFAKSTTTATDTSAIQPECNNGPDFYLHLTLPGFIEIPITLHTNLCTLTLSAHEGHMYIHTYKGTLKFYYPDYKQYYYLPEEDEAIHQSLAAFVDKSRRIKATKETCYTKKNGIFLPEQSAWFTPVYKENTVSDISFFEYQSLTKDMDCINHYLLELLSPAFH